LFQLLLEDLANLTESDKRAITEAMISLSTPVVAQSAFPVTNQQREALSAALHEITGQKSIIEFQCTHSLLAGMRIEIGPLILHANLRDELKFFSKPVQHEQ
jgi:F-type H+-transporting ATPase subunit b